MDLSIVIPTFNNAEYLDACLKYIHQNTYNNFEVIIVDDCSTDITQFKVKKWAQKMPLLNIELEENTRGTLGLNMGVLHSKCDFVVLMNDDMIVPPEWDKRMLEAMECDVICPQLIEPGIVPVHQDLVEYNCGKDIESFDYDKFAEYENNSRQPILVDQRVHPLIMSRKLYHAVGGHDVMMTHSDVDFYKKLQYFNKTIKKTLNTMIYHFSGVAFRNTNNSYGIENTRIFNLKWK